MLHGCPKIADVFVMEEILKKLGVKVIWEGHTLLLDAEQVTGYEVDRKLGCQMRSSIVLLGSLLGRCGQACVPYPGGCVIGKRPVDLHLAALEAMGAEFRKEKCCAPEQGKGRKADIIFRKAVWGLRKMPFWPRYAPRESLGFPVVQKSRRSAGCAVF